MRSLLFALFIFTIYSKSRSQLLVARDTISVIENGYVLKMPWANGLNNVNASNMDLNNDGVKDLVLYDRCNLINIGRFRCFINTGSSGQLKYKCAPDLSYYFPYIKNWAILKDYNGDGKEDIFCSNPLGITIYKNTSGSTPNFSLIKPLVYTNYFPSAPSPTFTNLYASTNGLPGIADIDKDGDLDVLTFEPQGIYVQYHQNKSELFSTKDSLIFNLKDPCWGKITESSCVVSFSQCSGSKQYSGSQSQPRELHAGSCLTCLDDDGDGDQDLIMGDIACRAVQYVRNNGTSSSALLNDTTQLYPNYPNKNSTTQINMNSFPCTYNLDVDNNGLNDLIASPNVSGSENFQSVWLYKNTGTSTNANFQLMKKNFLQDEMIEVGQNSFPVLFDYNADGKKDLLIGTYGYYNGLNLVSKLTLYKNTGTASVPSFSLISRDYGNISTQNLVCVMPTAGDVDGDGDTDILIGTSYGQVHWLENTAGINQPCNFSTFHNNPFSFTTTSAAAAPQLFDLDKDGKLDLLIGMKNGKISFYKNTGSGTTPAFSLITTSLGAVSVTANPLEYGLDGFAVPFFYDDTGATKLLVGSISGNIFQYQISNGISNSFSLINSIVNNLNEGPQSTVCFDDINNDGKRDLIIGNASGGLSFFSSAVPDVGFKENLFPESEIKIYPNPAKGVLNIDFSGAILTPQSGEIKNKIEFYNELGQIVTEKYFFGSMTTVTLENLPSGIYFVNLEMYSESGKKVFRKKLSKSE